MRLIDADALRQDIFFHRYGVAVLDNEKKILDEVFYMIDEAPTVQFILKAEPTAEQVSQLKELLMTPQKITIMPTQEHPRGEWKVDGCLIACDQCGRILLKASELYNFCPQCGAQMIGGGAE